jgi:Carboxypeptidase regulatory-like domain
VPVITGRVQDDQGKALTGVLLKFNGKQVRNPDREETKTTRGRFKTKELKKGEYEWSASKDDFVTKSGRIALGADDVELDIVLSAVSRTGVLVGRVLNDDGAGLPAAIVTAADLPGAGRGGEAQTNQDGIYLIEGLLPNKYQVGVAPPNGFQPPEPVTVEITAGNETPLDFKLMRVTFTGSLTGQVFDDAGVAVPDVRIVVKALQGRTQATTQTNADGQYLFEALPPGDFQLAATPSADFQKPESMNLTVKAQERTTHDFKLARVLAPGALSGHIFNQAGEGLAAIEMIARRRDASGVLQQAGQTVTDSNGAYIISPLAADKYQVHPQTPPDYQPVPALEVEVKAGLETRKTDFTLTPVAAPASNGSISGRVMVFHNGSGLIGLDGAEVAACDARLNAIQLTQTQNGGLYDLGRLDPGSYTVKVNTDQLEFLPAHNVMVRAAQATTGIDFSQNAVKDFLDRLDDARFSIESAISDEEALQAISFFSVVNLALAGLSLRMERNRNSTSWVCRNFISACKPDRCARNSFSPTPRPSGVK